jgi:hypothetical protein
MDESSVQERASEHVRTYRCADRLMVDRICRAAAHVFYALAAKAHLLLTFAEVLDFMYEYTRDRDQFLQMPVTASLVAHNEQLHPKVVEVVKRNKSYVWDSSVPALKEA